MKKNESVVRSKKFYGILLVGLFLSFIITACGGTKAEPQLTQKGPSGLLVSSGEIPPKPENSDPATNLTVLSDVGGGNNPIITEDVIENVELTPEVSQVSGNLESNTSIPDAITVEKVPPTMDPVAANLPVGVQIGYVAPDFSLLTPDGQTIRLSELRGRPVVVSYWASWCGPCKNEMQILQGVYQQYQDLGFTIVAVNAIGQDSLNEVTAMVSELGVTYPVVLDHGDEFAKEYNALFFPTSYFVDANGVIQDIALGDSPEGEFQARVQRFLAQ